MAMTYFYNKEQTTKDSNRIYFAKLFFYNTKIIMDMSSFNLFHAIVLIGDVDLIWRISKCEENQTNKRKYI
jgi:hypothetical protein